jgi:hypothetical protein
MTFLEGVMLNSAKLSSSGSAEAVFENVWRTSLSPPGFHWNDLDGGYDSRGLRAAMVALVHSLSDVVEHRTGRRFVPFSMGRFDQQVTTKFHLDGAPDESLLLLGYEPSEVESTLSIADYSRCAAYRGMSPSDFLDAFNPLFPAGEAALRGEIVALPPIPRGWSRWVAINNSRRAPDPNGANSLGVLRRGEIPAPDPRLSRVVNSLILTPAQPPFVDFNELTRGFVEDDRLSGARYRIDS